MSNITLRTTTNPTQSDLDAFLTILSTSYLHTPLTTSFITEIDATPPPYPSSSVTSSRLKSHFTLGITAISKSNILLTFASPSPSSLQSPPTIHPSPSSDNTPTPPLAAALIEPPQFTGLPPSQHRPNPGPILTQYRHLSTALRSKHLAIPDTGPHSYDQPAAPSQSSAGPSEDPYPGDFHKDMSGTAGEIRAFYHLAFVATADLADPDVADAVGAIVADVQGRAGADEVPVWMTVSSVRWKGLMEGLGFRVVDQVLVGEGRVDERGWPGEGAGKGVTVWALMWEA